MVNFFEICRRALEGRPVQEQEYDLHILFPALKKVIDTYQIKYDPNNPVPADDEQADKVFKAAIDFLVEAGIYCPSTNRIMEFDRKEVEESARTAPKMGFFGEGKDAGVFRGDRLPDDPNPPWCHCGSGIVASTEEIASSLVEGYGNILEADSISIPALETVNGLTIRSGTPLEIYGAIRTVNIGREALRRAGRPGLPILNLISTAGTTLSTIAASNPQFGLRPSDGWLLGHMAEMKLGFDSLNKVAYLSSWGANIAAESSPLLGGYCGGPEGTAILNTAYIISGRLALKSSYQLTFPISLRYSCSTTRDVLWAVSVSAQAISRNIGFPVLFLSYMASGPTTTMLFYETAAYMLTAVTSGAPGIQTAHPAKAVVNDHITPLEVKFSVEAAHAAAKLTRVKANDIVKELLAKYENNIKDAPIGKKYQECFNVKTGKPSDEYLDLYKRTKEELAGMGIPFQS